MHVILIGKNLSPSLAKARCEGARVLAADQGAVYGLKNKIHMDALIGDFDSVSPEEKKLLKGMPIPCVELPVHKDLTDTAKALSLCPEDEDAFILGGIQGNRVEHFLANVDLLRSRPNKTYLEDDDCFAFALKNSSCQLEKKDFEFVSVFALDECVLTLRGFEYPLDNFSLKPGNPLGISNRILEENGNIEVAKGILLVLCHKAS